MKIVKNSPERNAYMVIAGEMLNFETRTWLYDNGVKRDELGPEHKKYPTYTVDGTTYNIAAAQGTIYVPTGTDLERFIAIIENATNKLNPDAAQPEIMLYVGNGSYIKTTCSHRIIYTDNTDFNRKKNHLNSYTFMWHVVDVSKMSFAVSPSNPGNLIGVFWDAHNLLSEPHDTLSFTFGKDSFIATQRMVQQLSTIRIFGNGEPLTIMLNKYWHDHSTDITLREVTPYKVVEINPDQVYVIPVRLAESTAAHSKDICSRCKGMLYGEYYGLYNTSGARSPDKTNTGLYRVVPICALCLHTASDNLPIERRYQYVFRLKHHKTVQDIIAATDDIDTDILLEIAKSLTWHEMRCYWGTVQFCLIGDKYIGITEREHAMYSGIVNAPELDGRQFCKVKVV
jgi:hypothetical protein